MKLKLHPWVVPGLPAVVTSDCVVYPVGADHQLKYIDRERSYRDVDRHARERDRGRHAERNERDDRDADHHDRDVPR